MPAPLAQETAALLAVGPGAVLACQTAARLWGPLPRDANPDAAHVHLLVARRSPVRRAGITVHRTTRLQRRDLAAVSGLPVSAPLRTLLDLAASAPDRELDRAVREAQVRRWCRPTRSFARRRAGAAQSGCGRCSPTPSAGRRPARRPSAGSSRSSPGRDCPHPRSTSPSTATSSTPSGARSAWWPRSTASPSTRPGRRSERDRLRDGELQARGLRVVRVTWQQMASEPEALAARLGLALGYGGSAFGGRAG